MLPRAARKRVSRLHHNLPTYTSLVSFLNGVDLYAFKCRHNHHRTLSSTSNTSSRTSLKPYYPSGTPRAREKNYEVDDHLLFPAVKHIPQPSDDGDKPALVRVLSNLLRTLPPSAIARSPPPVPPSPSPSPSTPESTQLYNPIWNSPLPSTPPSLPSTLSDTAYKDWQSYFHTERHIYGFQGRTPRSRALVFFYNFPPQAEWREFGRALGRWGSVTRVWGVIKRLPHPLHRQRQGQESEKERKRESDHVKVYVEFASAEDTRAVLTRCMGHGFGWKMISGKRHYKHRDGKVPVMLWDYAEENSVREEFERGRRQEEGVREGDEGKRKGKGKKERRVPFTWIYVHRWRGTKGRLEDVFAGVEGFERVVLEDQIKGKPWRAAFVKFARRIHAQMALQNLQGKTIDLSSSFLPFPPSTSSSPSPSPEPQDPCTLLLSPDLPPYLLDPFSDLNQDSNSDKDMTVCLGKDKDKRNINKKREKEREGPRAWWDFGSADDPDVGEEGGEGKEDGDGYGGKEEEEVRYQFVLKPMVTG